MRRPADGGSATVEMAIMVPVAVVMMSLITVFGRVSLAQQAVDTAAYEAARSASLARTATTARSQASSAATTSLSRQNVKCMPAPVTSVNAAGFSVAVGQTATVSARVTCKVDLRDIVDFPGLEFVAPDSRTLTSTFTSPLDTYRSRT